MRLECALFFYLSEDIMAPTSSSLASCSSAIICFLANPQELLQQTHHRLYIYISPPPKALLDPFVFLFSALTNPNHLEPEPNMSKYVVSTHFFQSRLDAWSIVWVRFLDRSFAILPSARLAGGPSLAHSNADETSTTHNEPALLCRNTMMY